MLAEGTFDARRGHARRLHCLHDRRRASGTIPEDPRVPQIRPFAGIHFAKHLGPDLSNLIAPPFDVLDESSKAALSARHPNNIVTVDLPFLPPKAVGPDEVYAKANTTLQSWLSAKILEKSPRPAIYPYMQSFDHNGRTLHRRGFFAAVKISPFGQGQLVPHEQTYREAIEDRLKLMRATQAQLSPIFGLYSDSRHEINNLIYKNLGRPEFTGTLDGVQNDLWHLTDAEVINAVIDFIGRKPVFIADGHHRYTTALTYLQELQHNAGHPLPPNHPANFCMFSLVGMQDDGLLILPTHRLIGNVESFDIAAFKSTVADTFDITDSPLPPSRVAEYVEITLPMEGAHTFGLYDGRTRRLYQLTCKDPNLLYPLEPLHSEAWRRLDVAILQRYLLDEIISPRFAGAGQPITKGYTAAGSDIVPRTDGKQYQIALLLKSTPLGALEQLSVQNELMPQKSTYFYPKLATGMVINSVAIA
jgi:uncharacterized protein (DUF1015 family)